MKTIFTKISKSILVLMVGFTLSTGVAFAATTLQDGQYNIGVEALNATTGAPSMANDSIKKPVKLEVKNSKIYVILEMADSMYDLAAQNSAGGFDLAEELSENTAAKTITYKFNVKSIEEPILMETIVAAMGRKVNLKLAFDKASLVNVTPKSTTPATKTTTTVTTVNTTTPTKTTTATKTTPSTKTITPTKTTPSETTVNTATNINTNTNVQNPKTGDDTFVNLFNVILLAFGVSIVAYGFHKTKKATSNQ